MPASWLLVFSAWLVAAGSALGALFFSDVMGIAPCTLCWWQRVFMFPLVLVLGVGLFPLNRTVFRYAVPLVAAGWLVALWHVLLTQGVIAESLSPCTQGIPCSNVDAVWFGFVTLPLLSLVAFSAIAATLLAASTRVRP
jgi:disulfide bond formation protein DsbB